MGGRGGERVQEGASGAKLGRAGWPPTYATLGVGAGLLGAHGSRADVPPQQARSHCSMSPDSKVTGPRALGVIQS